MAHTRKLRRYQFLGWIIEKGRASWYVLDFDMEGWEGVVCVARSEKLAQEWIMQHS